MHYLKLSCKFAHIFYWHNKMKHYKKLYILPVLFILFSNLSFAQRSLKYENIVKRATELSPKEAYGLYSDFLSLNPFVERANAYFQMAELSAKMMNDYNTLTDYLQIKKLYDNSRNYYALCKQYINDNEARKDQAFFSPPVQPAQKRMVAQDVISYIQGKLRSDSLYFEDITSVYNSYTAMVNSYINSMNTYYNICKNNRNLNDLYINWTENTTLISSLKQSFDSVTYLKSQLRDKIPGFSLKDINNFKTDGFSPANFNSVSEIWDYKGWAVKQENYYNKNILPVINESSELIQQLNNKIDNINRSKKPNFTQAPINKILMDKLRDMRDITPIYAEIEQRNKTIDFINIAYDEKNKAKADTYSIESQAKYIASVMKAYSDYMQITNKIDTDYPAIKLNNTEKELINSLYEKCIDNYKQYVLNAENVFRTESHITYNKKNIPLNQGFGFYRPSTSGYITKNVFKNADRSMFLSGASINSQGFSIAYTAYSNDATNITWLKTVDISKVMFDDCSMAISKIPSGVMSLISSKNVSDPLITTQTIVRYDMKGAEKEKITLPDKNLPLGRHISYDEITGTTLLAFYGETEDWFQNDGKLIIQKNKGDKQLFRVEILLNGNVIDIKPLTNGGYMVFGNYNSIEIDGKKETSDLGIYTLVIDKEGKVKKLTTYKSDKARYSITSSRVSADKFIISGIYGESVLRASAYPADAIPVLLVIDDNGNLLYNYEQNKNTL